MNDLSLKINGKASTLGIRDVFIHQQINEIPSAQIMLLIPADNGPAQDRATNALVSRFATGDSIDITLDNKTLFSGYVTHKKIYLRGNHWSVRLEVRHVLQRLMSVPRSRVFHNKKDSDILKALFSEARIMLKLTPKAVMLLKDVAEQMVQFRASDWHFLLSRMVSTGCCLLADITSQTVTIRALDEMPGNTHTLVLNGKKEPDIYEVNLNFDNRFTLDSTSLRGWDITRQQLTEEHKSTATTFLPWKVAGSTASPASAPWQRDYSMAFSHQPESALRNLSSAWQNYRQMSAVQGDIHLAGQRKYQPGEWIKLSGFGCGIDGNALITGLNQRFSIENGWRSELLFGLPASPADLIPAVRSLHVARVAAYKADPKNLDRIPVHIPALNLATQTVFARLLKPWASKESGFCFYPQPGDEVIIGFIENDPRYPAIIGAMHNPINKAPFSPDNKNAHKGLISTTPKSVVSLMFDTQDNELTLSCGENKTRMTDKGDVSLSTSKTINLNAQTIVHEASNSIRIKGKSQVEITSANINMKK